MSIDLYNGDCIEIMKSLPEESVDLILCDLPYGITHCGWDKIINFESLWSEYNRILKPLGTTLLFASGQFLPKVLMSNLKDYKYLLNWVKNTTGNFVNAKNRPLTKVEQIAVFSKGVITHKSVSNRRMTYNPQGLIREKNPVKKPSQNKLGHWKKKTSPYLREFRNYPTDILEFNALPCHKKLHTSEKPVTLLEYLIKTYTNENEIVLDNCMGSGSTGEACINTNRNFIGIELDKDFYEIAKHRLNKAGGTT